MTDTLQTYEEICAERDAAWIKHLELVGKRDEEWIKTLQMDVECANRERDHLAKLLRKEQDRNDALREQVRELSEALQAAIANGEHSEIGLGAYINARAALARYKGAA